MGITMKSRGGHFGRPMGRYAAVLMLCAGVFASTAAAGPVILGGDDLTDHGSRSGTTLSNGWLYIQKALENLAPAVTRAGNDGSVAILGSADSTATSSNAGAAYHFAVPNAAATTTLSGVVTFHNGAAAINTFFAGLVAGTNNPAIIVTAGTGARNDLDASEGTALTANALEIANFVNSGGGLLSHSAGSTAYGWLSTLIPGATFPGGCSRNTLSLTPAGILAFPGLTNANIRSGPCHNNFRNHGLGVLAKDGNNRDIIIGGATVQLPGQLALTPSLDLNPPGSSHIVSANVIDGSPPNNPLPGILVSFSVLAGPNMGASGSDTTNVFGNASFTYISNGTIGLDEIRATFVDPTTGGTVTSNIVLKVWDNDCQFNGIPDTCDISCAAFAAVCAAFAGCGGSVDSNNDGFPDECVPPNSPPVCDANGAYSASCAGTTTTVQLDGSGSSDPDGDSLTFKWTIRNCVGGTFNDDTSSKPAVTSPSSPGCSLLCTVNLDVTDTGGLMDSCCAEITITDTTAPTVACPGDKRLECPANTSVGDNGSATGSDFCDPAPSVASGDSSVAGCGNTETITRTWRAKDNCGLATSCDQTITVVDTTPPVLNVDTMPITVTDVDCSGDEAVTLPIPSATDTCGGVTITDDALATYPAGQTTTVTFTATDDCGNSSSASVDVTVLFGADIWVSANKHTVGGGSNPGSTKEPFVGIEICAYDKADGSCARVTCGGISHQHYECIATTCPSTNCCTTDADGMCNLNLPPGDYVVISIDATKTTLPNPLGVSASDLVCGEHKRKHLQQIVKIKSDGSTKKTPGKTTRRTGSELLIIEPEYVIWDGTVQEYPFVFETVGDWGITASVAPPEGFVSDYDSLSADVYDDIQVVQFTITEVGSDLVPTGTTFEVTHKGRREIIHSQVGIFLTAKYARSRGFNVAQLRAAGLIKELPVQAAFGQNQRGNRGE